MRDTERAVLTPSRRRRTAAGSLLVAGLALAILPLSPGRSTAGGNCTAPPKGLVAMTDLPATGTMKYDGYLGGLYPSALNVPPPSHEAAGAFYAGRIVPRDGSGQPDPGGRIGLVTIGFSNTRDESEAFMARAAADPLRSPAVSVVNGAEGGASADVISDPSSPYWDRVLARVAQAGLTAAQVQVVWMVEAVPHPTAPFPDHALQLQQYLTAIVQILHARFPNAVQCFLSSRIYAGYATTTLNPEPYAYESGFAVKWLIQAQIDGDPALNHDARRGKVVAPWLAWGPYLWADGLDARADGLTWICSDFATDGTHPSPSGSAKVGAQLVDFFRNDPVTSPWYGRASSPTGVEPVLPAGSWTIEAARPNPFRERLSIPLDLRTDSPVRAAVYTADGRRVRTLADRRFAAGDHVLTWDGRDEAGRAAVPGVYFVRVTGSGVTRTAKVTRIR